MPEHMKMTVKLSRLFLAVDNPRHGDVDDEDAAIARLCAEENIVQLASDIAKFGINPAERLITVPFDETEAIGKNTTFIVAEGNRRVCALKLLSDPDRAPANIRSRIEKYASEWDPIVDLDAVVITDEKLRRHWLLRIHDGMQDGKGRKAWNAEQKTRFNGSSKNVVAQALFDYAESKGLLSPDDRRGRLSHMSRLLGNALVKDALGLKVGSEEGQLYRTRPEEDFDLVLREVLAETEAKQLGSQARKDDIDNFAIHSLQQLEGLTGHRIDQVDVVKSSDGDLDQEDGDENEDAGGDEGEDAKPKPPKPPKKPSQLPWNEVAANSLQEGQFHKLSALYYSVCSVNSSNHASLVAVGVWAFLESLAKSCNSGVPFKDFWNRGKLSQMGVASGQDAKAFAEALERLAKGGNTTKHDAVSAVFDSQQMINDWLKIQPLVAAAVEEAKLYV